MTARPFDELADKVRAEPGAEAEIADERRRAEAELERPRQDLNLQPPR